VTLLRNALPGSDRENVRQTQGLATHLNPLQQIPNRLPLCNCSRRSRYLLVMSPDPNTDEVLATARDLMNDRAIYVDRSMREVHYIHMLLPSHEVMFANGVESESSHPASAGLEHLDDMDRKRLFSQVPEIAEDVNSYGAYARRVVSSSEAAILSHDAA
jgi:hypothetical protein